MNPRRLYRCRHDRQLAGVAAGMAEYLELDPTLVRVLWILSAFVGGVSIVLYIILAFVIPLEPITAPGRGAWQPAGPWGAPPPMAGGPTGDPSTAADSAAGTTAAGEQGAGGAGPAWSAAPGAASYWWSAPQGRAHEGPRRPGRAGLYGGILLVAFGAIALADQAIPGWAGSGHLWPAFLVVVGVLLLAGSLHRAPRSE